MWHHILVMSSTPTRDELQKAAKSFNKVLNRPNQASSSSKTLKAAEEGMKKLRTLILVDGIPHAIVSTLSYSKI